MMKRLLCTVIFAFLFIASLATAKEIKDEALFIEEYEQMCPVNDCNENQKAARDLLYSSDEWIAIRKNYNKNDITKFYWQFAEMFDFSFKKLKREGAEDVTLDITLEQFDIDLISFIELLKMYDLEVIEEVFARCMFLEMGCDSYRNIAKKCPDSKKKECRNEQFINAIKGISPKLTNAREREDRKKIRETELKQFVAKIEREEKFGLRTCTSNEWVQHISDGIHLDCMVVLTDLLVKQQIDDGTLVTPDVVNMSRTFDAPIARLTYLIETNPADKKLVTNAATSGLFVITGTYNYRTAFGATNTAYKIKRLE